MEEGRADGDKIVILLGKSMEELYHAREDQASFF